jgi:hypothetical protein
MRKLIFVIAVLTGTWVIAQTKTYVGIKGGVGATTAYMQHSVIPLFIETQWLPGFNGGIQITHFPEKYRSRVNAGIQIGVNYSQKGWVQRFKDTGEPNHTTRINYLELPIEAVGYFGNKTKYYVSAGLFLEYALSANVDPTPASAVQDTETANLLVGPYHFTRFELEKDHRLSYGPRGAVGVFRETGAGVFRLEAFFTFSVRSAYNYEPLDSGIPDLSLNYGAGISVGYMFSFGKMDL